MAGIKGMKWKGEKINNIKVNSSLSEAIFKKVYELSAARRWSISEAIRYLIERGLE